MKILHTSDWHVGRTFHGNSTLEHLEQALNGLVEIVTANQVNVVVVAGDIFDSAVPSAAAMEFLGRILRQITDAGSQIVLTSGNHDSAARLGFLSGFTSQAGLHIFADPTRLDQPVSIADPNGGEVLFFGIPFLEPIMVRHLDPEQDLRTQHQVLNLAMDRIRAAVPPGARYVVAAHTFAVPGGSSITSGDVDEARLAPRDFTRGGVDSVSAKVFDGATYVALGHLHGRKKLADHIRYSGAPLYYNFDDIGARGAWLVEIAQDGALEVSWVDMPIPRQKKQLRGKLQELLSTSEHSAVTDHWIKAILTDNTRPVDPMRLLQQRFPYCADIGFDPENQYVAPELNTIERMRTLSDAEITADFLKEVRNGEGPTEKEQDLINELVRNEN